MVVTDSQPAIVSPPCLKLESTESPTNPIAGIAMMTRNKTTRIYSTIDAARSLLLIHPLFFYAAIRKLPTLVATCTLFASSILLRVFPKKSLYVFVVYPAAHVESWPSIRAFSGALLFRCAGEANRSHRHPGSRPHVAVLDAYVFIELSQVAANLLVK